MTANFLNNIQINIGNKCLLKMCTMFILLIQASKLCSPIDCTLGKGWVGVWPIRTWRHRVTQTEYIPTVCQSETSRFMTFLHWYHLTAMPWATAYYLCLNPLFLLFRIMAQKLRSNHCRPKHIQGVSWLNVPCAYCGEKTQFGCLEHNCFYQRSDICITLIPEKYGWLNVLHSNMI